MRFLDDHLIVNGWTHTDINGVGAESDVISLKNFNHVAIVLDFGDTTAGGDADIVVYASDDVSKSHTTALESLTYRKSGGGTDDDSFSAAATVTDSKLDYVAAGEIVPDTDDNAIVVIEVRAVDVKTAGSDYDCLYVDFGDPGEGCPVGCKFILSGPRFAGEDLPSAITD